MTEEEIWKVRSKVYDQLDWTRRQEYMSKILQMCKLKSSFDVCDVGTGTGVVAKALSNYCNSVVGLDISQDMLDMAKSKNNAKNIQYIKGNIEYLTTDKRNFAEGIFDVITARMVFHHIDHWDKAMEECKKTLKKGGRLVISEGVPPPGALSFHSNFLTKKENRKIFIVDDLIALFKDHSFKDIDFDTFVMKDVSIKNWLENSGLPKEKQDMLYKMRLDSPLYAQKAENMRIYNGDILTDWHFVIITGVKR